MAKFERQFEGDFGETLARLDDAVMHSGVSASFEDGSDWRLGETRAAVRVYERYSWLGGNRVSLTVALVGQGRDLSLSAIASGGSQAVFWKINTIGEESFLDNVRAMFDD